MTARFGGIVGCAVGGMMSLTVFDNEAASSPVGGSDDGTGVSAGVGMALTAGVDESSGDTVPIGVGVVIPLNSDVGVGDGTAAPERSLVMIVGRASGVGESSDMLLLSTVAAVGNMFDGTAIVGTGAAPFIAGRGVGGGGIPIVCEYIS